MVSLLECVFPCLGDLYFIEPPSWSKTGNWRPPSQPETTFYWKDTTWAPACQWDIGRLLKEELAVPVRIAMPLDIPSMLVADVRTSPTLA
jgi:hypothetical protein